MHYASISVCANIEILLLFIYLRSFIILCDINDFYHVSKLQCRAASLLLHGREKGVKDIGVSDDVLCFLSL